MIKAATKDEVIQVAHNLLDPLLEAVHQEIENLRAQVVAEGKSREAQDIKLVAATAEVRREAILLGKDIQRLRDRAVEWDATLKEIKQIRDQINVAVAEIQRAQSRHAAELMRMDKSIKALWLREGGS